MIQGNGTSKTAGDARSAEAGVQPLSTLHVMALMEAYTVTGPAKNLIDFSVRARRREHGAATEDLPAIRTTVTTYHRSRMALHPTSMQATEFIDAVRKAGIDMEILHERYRFDLRVVPALRQLVEQHAPDIVQTHNVKSHFAVKLSGLWKTRPWIAFHHGYTAINRMDSIYNQFNRFSLRSAERVVTMNRSFADMLIRTGVRPDRIHILHNAVDLESADRVPAEDVRNLRATLCIPQGERIVLAVGRLSFEKGHADLVRAMAEMGHLRTDIHARLVLVGEGPERSRLEEIAEQLGIGDRIVFTGQVRNVMPYYAVADVMVLPSHSEGSPNVLLEAMAARLPIVATAVGGIPEMVTHEEGALLTAPQDPQAMAGQIIRLLTDAPLARRLAGESYRIVSTHYSPEARVRSLVTLYAAVLRRQKDTP